MVMSAIIPAPDTTKLEDSSKIFNQLLDCVQQCQRRFGGKAELATDFDSCVVSLCLTLEAVLLHGLKNKPVDIEKTSTLKQVSDIISSSLNLTNENISFWPFVKKHLTKHEIERYEFLSHIWTDCGRGRAWLRSSLNERSLERYFYSFVNDKDLLKKYYCEGALLRDEEKSNLLPNMAAGLCSILFAISINKPDLNSGVQLSIRRVKEKSEPIIEVPVPVGKSHRRNRKVAKQIILFDEEDSSAVSTSVPSSCESFTSSEINSVIKMAESQSEVVEESQIRNNDPHTQKEKPKHRVSIESIRTSEQYVVDGTLTPVEQTNIGELTPISVERNEIDSPDTSDNIIEVPTDISAVLTAVENKNKEEIKKLQSKIETLTKEKQTLQEQLKNYVSAIMLNDTDGNILKDIKELKISEESTNLPDYKNEAKLFEQKLIQVAEMHAELMDFNVRLQTSLNQKDTLLDRLKRELEELRGPVPADELGEEVRNCVNVWIPSAFLTGSGSDAHHVYQIFLRAGNDEWNIYRRYAQFYNLHCDLKKVDPIVATFDFPPKKSIGKKDSTLVENRRKRLQTYLRKVLAHWPELSHCNSRYLLEQHLPFFKDKTNDDKNKNEGRRSVFSSRKNTPMTADSHYTGL
ncbi:sorting nexin-29 isoform X2 [Agrilus planipennis]|uniref:Sorting nexin-29 isoform X2 n=1 Tax=Agrilus planipennis TaxID=224129 RepID=A0A1W4X2G1_AGRPL|nr:sorting nexin-29 isoform X2 [Agrilus planipennis]